MDIKEQITPKISLIDLDVPVVRDEMGHWSNPAIPDFDGDADACRAWLLEQGLETMSDCLEVEDIDHPVYVSYYDEGDTNISEWECAPVPGQGWHTFSIHDTEDGPVWVWARRAGAAGSVQP